MKLNEIFRSHMVLQANKPVRVFGTGEGTVTVSINGNTATAKADGDWVVELPKSDYSGPHIMKVQMNEETVVLHDIYFGDVILLAGQSNLQFRMENSTYPAEDYKGNDMLRYYCTKRPEEGQPISPEDGWVVCDTENAGHWSAIGYHVAHQLYEQKQVAIGIVACFQGGSSIQSWMPHSALAETDAYIPFEKRHSQYEWNKDGFNYDFIFKKLIPLSFKAVVWYQGESNRRMDEAQNYHFMLTTLINLWREDLKDETLPFIVIQIADYMNEHHEGWKTVQAAQIKISETMDNVYSVISADVCEKNDIHPPTKIHLAKRITDKLLKV